MKRFFILISMVMCLLYIPSSVSAGYEADKEWSVIKHGDVIYLDTTGLDWDEVYIHIWQDGGAVYKDWSNDDEMTKVDDNIYMFVLPDSADEIYNMIIFKNGMNGTGLNQTISLGYIEGKFAYKITDISNGKRFGYWYLYDKSDLESRLEDILKYQNDKDYYTTSSYGNLDDLIQDVKDILEEEIKLESTGGNPEMYYIQVDYTFGQIDDIIDSLVVDTTLLEEKITLEESNMSDYEGIYTPSSLEELKSAIEDGKNVLSGTNITVEDIKNSIKKIDDSKENLVKQADKTELNKLIDEISKLNKDDYTTKSYDNLATILEDALIISNDKNATQTDVDNYVEKLKAGIGNLELKEEISVPKTLDNIVVVISVLAGAIVVLGILVLMKRKMNK